jgi:predicted acylesterase/phospholipase RssA
MVDFVTAQFHRLLDYTVPVVSLLKGARISRRIEVNFGSWDIEDLWLPYYCVSTNLTTSRLEVHRRGPAAKFIRASVAIPGVLPPIAHSGELLVDGGVLNNLPVTPMRNDGAIGTVIAVDVAPTNGPRARADFGPSVSGSRALVASLRKRSTYPSVSAVVLRSMLTGAVSHQREAMRDGVVDLLVNLHSPGIGLLEFDRVDGVARAGHERSLPLIAEWASRQSWLRTPA